MTADLLALDTSGCKWSPTVGSIAVRLSLFVPLVLAIAVPVAAHDVWMEANPFVVPVETIVPYRIFVGHGPAREPWDVGPARIIEMQSLGPRSRVDLKPTRSETGAIRFGAPGTYVVTMVSSASLSDLPALRFNDYAAAEGLSPIIALRARFNQAKSNGRELYSRRTKMLIKVGNARTPQLHILRPVGLSLEIVPQVDPFLTIRGQPLPFAIYYQGKPLAGATLKLTNLNSDAAPVARAITNADGQAVLAHPGKGRWQANVVWSRPLIGNRDAEFETVFSSLTFGS